MSDKQRESNRRAIIRRLYASINIKHSWQARWKKVFTSSNLPCRQSLGWINQATDGSVCPSPGCKDSSEWLVKSTSLKQKSPYFVQCQENGKVVCEPSCGLFKSSKVCVHTVSVACHTGKLGVYLQWLLKQKEDTKCVQIGSNRYAYRKWKEERLSQKGVPKERNQSH